jgi:hypothetical protein
MLPTFRTTKRSDLHALSAFLVRAYKFEPSDFHFDPQLLEWKYLYPRSDWQFDRSYLLERDGNIVAHAGVCPVTFRLPTGQTVRSLTILDWAAEAKTGLGVVLFRKLMQMAPTSFVIGGAPVTREVVPRIGFRHVGDAPTYAAWLRPLQEFRIRPRNGRSLLRLLHGLTHPVPTRTCRTKQWEFVLVRQFDDSLQPILNRGKRPWTSCQRTVADLNYSLQCPHLKMQGFLLRREGRLAGYFILGNSDWETRVLDIVVDSEVIDDWKYACVALTNAALLDPASCRIRILSTMPLLTRALVWNGYWHQYKEPILLHDPAHTLSSAFPVHFQYLDGDSGY